MKNIIPYILMLFLFGCQFTEKDLIHLTPEKQQQVLDIRREMASIEAIEGALKLYYTSLSICSLLCVLSIIASIFLILQGGILSHKLSTSIGVISVIGLGVSLGLMFFSYWIAFTIIGVGALVVVGYSLYLVMERYNGFTKNKTTKKTRK